MCKNEYYFQLRTKKETKVGRNAENIAATDIIYIEAYKDIYRFFN